MTIVADVFWITDLVGEINFDTTNGHMRFDAKYSDDDLNRRIMKEIKASKKMFMTAGSLGTDPIKLTKVSITPQGPK